MDFLTQLFCDLSSRDSILVLLFLLISYLLGLLTAWFRRSKHESENYSTALSTSWETEKNSLLNKLKNKENEVSALRNEMNSLKNATTSTKNEKQKLSATLAASPDISQEVSELKHKIKISEGEIESLKGKMLEQSNANDRMKIELKESTEKLANLNVDTELLGSLKSKNDELAKELATWKIQADENLALYNKAKQANANVDSSKETDALKVEVASLKSQLASSSSLVSAPVDHSSCEAKALSLENEIAALRTKLENTKTPEPAVKVAASITPEPIAMVAAPTPEPVKLELPKGMKMDDLKEVEGIGPKIESILHEGGIKTWLALSESTPTKISEILIAVDEKYRIHNPESWPQQAALLAAGKWEEFQTLCDKLKGGRIVN